jgi:hypothetical protein
MVRWRSVPAELAWVAVGLACYLVVRAVTLDRLDEAHANAADVLALERDLGLDWEHAVQDVTLGLPWFSTAVAQFYFWAYFPTLVVTVVWLFLRHPAAYATMRNAVLASLVVGFVGYAVFPCAPPRIADEGYVDTVTDASLAAVERPIGITNEVAAMPSFHIAWLLVAAVVVFGVTRNPVLRVLCVAVPVLMAYAVVATGNHWVLDIPAGAVVGVAGLAVAGVIRARRPAADGTGPVVAVGSVRDAG